MKYVDLEKYGKTRCWRELRGERERKEVKKGKFDRDRNGKREEERCDGIRWRWRWGSCCVCFFLGCSTPPFYVLCYDGYVVAFDRGNPRFMVYDDLKLLNCKH